MSQTVIVTRLALRELWISYRLLLVLAAYVGAGAIVAFLPPGRPVLDRLALLAAGAALIGAGIAARSISTERALGRAGWLVTRAVPRGTIVVGWFAALAAVTIIGLLTMGVLAWFAASAAIPRLDPRAFAAVFGGTAAASLAAIAIGLLLGALVSVRLSVPGAVGLCLVVGAAAWLGAPALLPLAALPALPELERPISIGLQGAGAALTLSAGALVLARFVLGRVDL